jgi:hypothetical protein
LNRAECKAACRFHLIIMNRRNIGIKLRKSDLMCTDRAVLLLAYTKQMLPLIDWYIRLAGRSVTKLIGLHELSA